MPINGTFQLKSGYVNNTSPDITGTTVDTAATISVTNNFKPGTGVNQIDRAFRKKVTLADAATDNLILSALPGATGIAKVCQFVVVVASATGSVRVSPGTTNGWTNGIGGSLTAQSNGTAMTDDAPGTTTAGAIALLAPGAGYLVGAGANEQVTFTAVGAVTYWVHVLGRSA